MTTPNANNRRNVNWTEIIPLAAWAVFFVFILVSKRLPLYINPRFELLPAFGAIVLAAMVAALWFGHTQSDDHEHEHGNDHLQVDWTHVSWFTLPVILGLIIAPAGLGAFVAGRQHGMAWSNQPGNSGISLNLSGNSQYADCNIAQLSDAGHITSGKVAIDGQISLQGAKMPAGECSLVHYRMVCCVADLRVVGVTLKYAVGYKPADGQWVHVEGKASRQKDGVYVDADVIQPIPQPDPPYLF
jgi:uncharacterized repeat protein (TIGR03943 family)